jgi:hypothetical protein
VRLDVVLLFLGRLLVQARPAAVALDLGLVVCPLLL